MRVQFPPHPHPTLPRDRFGVPTVTSRADLNPHPTCQRYPSLSIPGWSSFLVAVTMRCDHSPPSGPFRESRLGNSESFVLFVLFCFLHTLPEGIPGSWLMASSGGEEAIAVGGVGGWEWSLKESADRPPLASTQHHHVQTRITIVNVWTRMHDKQKEKLFKGSHGEHYSKIITWPMI